MCDVPSSMADPGFTGERPLQRGEWSSNLIFGGGRRRRIPQKFKEFFVYLSMSFVLFVLLFITMKMIYSLNDLLQFLELCAQLLRLYRRGKRVGESQ